MDEALPLDAIVDELDRRVQRFGAERDPAAVLDDTGTALLSRAWALVVPAELDAWTALVLARFHWCRFVCLPDGDDAPDHARAVELFTALWHIDPDAVPDPIRELLEQDEGGPATVANDSGARLFELFERTGDPGPLDAALDAFATAVEACPEDGSELRRYLSNLAGAHLARFGVAGGQADLDTAIAIGERAAALDSGDEQVRAATLGNLAIARRTRYERTEHLPDLDAAIQADRDAVALLPAGHPDVGTYLSALANGLRMRFERTDTAADLDEALAAVGQAVRSAPPGDPDRPIYLDSLANCCLVRYARYGDADDLDRAIEAGSAAVRGTPAGRLSRLGYLTNLGNALRERYVRGGSPADLEAGIAAGREAVEAAPDGHPLRAGLLSNLGALLRTRASRTGSVADLDEAVALAAAASAEPASPNRATMLANSAVALLTRFDRLGRPDDLDAAIEAVSAAVAATPDDHPERGPRLSDLGNALLMRYVHRGGPDDLDAAVGHAHTAVAAARPDHPDLGRYLSNLAYTLRLRSAVTDDPADLDAAVAAGQEAVAWLPPGRQERPGYLVNLSSALASRFQRYGRDTDIDEAVERSRAAVAETADDHADLPGRWNNLSVILRVRFEATGRLADADEAVTLARLAVAGTPADHAERPTWLTNLAGTLRVRFLRTGAVADLDEAVVAGRAAVAGLPVGHPQRGGYLSNLSNALRARFDEQARVEDLDEALETASAAVAATPDGTDRPQYLSNLSAVLLTAVEHDPSALARLDAAIAAADEAVATAPGDHPERGRFLANLGNALITRGRADDLVRAAEATAEAVRITPPDHPDHAGFLFGAGHAEHLLDPAAGVPDAWRRAAAAPTAPAAIRLRTARAWGDTAAAAGDAADAAAGFAAAVRLLPVLAWRGLDRDVRELHLWRWSGLAGDACAWQLRAGDPRRAVELLEQGRSIMWNQIVQTRTDLSAAQAAAPELMARLTELRAALDAPTTRVEPEPSAAERERLAQAQRRLAEEWDDALARIRALDGLDTFLAAVPYERLTTEAAHGPIVTVNVSRFGCAAIVLTTADPVVVELPELTRADTVERANALLQTRLAAESARSFATLRAAHQTLLDVLAWLYDTVVAPVLAKLALEPTGPGGELPQIWWCPTGPLTMLPLHAAGHYGPGGTESLLDRAVSSYVPTIGALHRARSAADPAPAGALIVAQPLTPDLPPLPYADEEARIVRGRLPAGTVLSGAEATAEQVLARLAEHGWAHLSCHGRQDPTQPARSALFLHDRPITVAELAGHRFPGGQLAFLSACETSTGGVRVLDEAMHLSAAFGVAGFRHVIATLWAISDERAALVADDVYATLTATGAPDATRAARALHDAVGRLRAEHPHAPLLWAPYVHSGP
ncbi:CHAT domain-containing protein [Dactylosporangium sp. AC04546]|uniref:CHAT domain-containing protein n=1 Tax=Dactylosporangium sp. AC04546 TaxID=2862460 RepID=UPI001EE12ABE|nr:CHAT domain-containing protein [Dactylosporangium sp. AC04546]WVK88774.1 CHAT domain-containing protein [Dactylosporangium sp. AC04546]